MTATELTTTVRNLKDLMNMREELESEIAAAQDAIKAEMTARDTDEMKVDVSKVTWMLPLGVWGVLYPPRTLDDIVFAAGMFSRICPYADDIWFKMASLKKNTLCVQTGAENIKLATVEGGQEVNLTKTNVKMGMNDLQFEACFEHYPDLLDKLKREFEQDPDYSVYDDWIKASARGGAYFVWIFKYLPYKALSAILPMKAHMGVKADKHARRLETAKSPQKS